MNTRKIEILNYNPEWARLFEKEKELLSSSIREYVISIEHIGSTSVNALGAKPVIDIMIGVEKISDADKCIEPILKLGYDYVSQYENIMPYRRFFRKEKEGIRTHHIHMVETTHEFWERHLLFRDFLRKSTEDANNYFLLKKELAEKFPYDPDGYNDGKTNLINEILQKSRMENSIS